MSHWSFSLNTGSWKYDLLSVSISPLCDDTSLDRIVYKPKDPLYQNTKMPRLNANEVVAYFEHEFGDYLYMVAALGQTRQVGLGGKLVDDFVRHGCLTFGAVVNRRKPGIIAHLPSTRDERPKLYCEGLSVDVEASAVACRFCRSGILGEIKHIFISRYALRMEFDVELGTSANGGVYRRS
ncbi:hypothetical protein PQX77_017451 [Marasmius sp. AFHP31]|nr:hypothetical protein PQX77_017451 [Marasmius sp. AFHP31]